MSKLKINKDGSLQAQAYNYVKEKILTRTFDANVLYSETKLAAELGISRTPLRESLQCLCQDGYIIIIPSKGFMIRELNEQDMLESIQIRCAIEGFCTHVIANEIESKKGQQLLKSLSKSLEHMKRLIDSDEYHETFMYNDQKFHNALIDYVDNKEFSETYQRLMYLIQLTTLKALSVPGRIEGTIEEHEQFFNYLKAGDGNSAYNILIKHLMMPVNMHIAD